MGKKGAQRIDRPAESAKAPVAFAVGSGVYWATVMFNPRPTSFFSGDGGGAGLATLAVAAVCALVALSALALSGRFAKCGWQKGLALAAAVSSLLCLALLVAARALPEEMAGLGWIFGMLDGVSGASLMLFWGLCFASLDKETAGHAVLSAALLGCALLAILLAIPTEDDAALVAAGLKSLSPMLFVAGGFTLYSARRTFRPESAPLVAGFFASRAGIGATLGFAGVLASGYAGHWRPGSALMAAAALAFAGLALYFVLRRREDLSLLAVVPLAFAGCLHLLLFRGQDDPAAIASWGLTSVWFAWITLSSVQISEYKEAFGLSESFLTFAEKSVVLVFWLIGGMLASLLGLADAAAAHPFDVNAFVAALVLLWLAVVTYFFVKLAQTKERGRLVEQALATPDENLREVCAAIAESHGLSVREGEILVLLVQGHTRAYICEHFVLSAGTVKSHITHIYQKLGIHNKESLFKLFDAAKEELARRKRFEGSSGARGSLQR